CWKAVAAFPSGDTAIVIGLLLRDLAAKIQQKGRLLFPNGNPMDLVMIAASIGRDVVQVEFAIRILQLVGTITINGATVSVTDPLLFDHFKKVEALMTGDKVDQKRALSALRSKKYRDRNKIKHQGDATLSSQNSHHIMRDDVMQLPDVTIANRRHDTSTEEVEVISTTTCHKEKSEFPNLPPVLDTSDNRSLMSKLIDEGYDRASIRAEVERAVSKGKVPADYLYHALKRMLAGHPGFAEATAKQYRAIDAAKSAENAKRIEDEKLRKLAHSPESCAAARAALEEMDRRFGLSNIS
ncbi:hypothetical protein FDZ73_19090, partial [bacterium]